MGYLCYYKLGSFMLALGFVVVLCGILLWPWVQMVRETARIRWVKPELPCSSLRFAVIFIHSHNRLLSTFYVPHLELGPEGELPVFGSPFVKGLCQLQACTDRQRTVLQSLKQTSSKHDQQHNLLQPEFRQRPSSESSGSRAALAA